AGTGDTSESVPGHGPARVDTRPSGGDPLSAADGARPRLHPDRGRPAAIRRLCPRGTARSGPHRGSQGEQATGRAVRPGTTRTPRSTVPTPLAGLPGSWQKVSDLGVRPVCQAEPADHLDPDQGARGKLGDPGARVTP